MRLVFFAMMASGWLGCSIGSNYDGTAYTCEQGRCPDGFRCVGGKCLDGDAGSIDATALDAPTLDAALEPDADACAFDPRSDTCQPADLEELSAVSQPGGQTVCGSTAGNTNALIGCTGAPMPAADSVFRFAATTGQQITAVVRPMGFNGSVYLLTDCSGQCLTIADAQGVGGMETAQFTATSTGDHYVVVDSGTGTGAYELTVTVE